MATMNLTEQQRLSLLEEFKAGVTATLRSWSALRAAVESDWGGTQSKEKAEVLRQSIYSYMDGSCFPPKIDIMDLEDSLAIYMEEEFSVQLEDNSEKQVADMLWRMYEGCFGCGDPTLCHQMVATANQAASQATPVKVQTTEHDDDDEMEGDSTTNQAQQQEASMQVAQEFASESLFGPLKPSLPRAPEQPVRQLGEQKMEKQEYADNDGFVAVPTKRRNRKS